MTTGSFGQTSSRGDRRSATTAIAALALSLAAGSPAKADEMAALQTAQQLLERRLDQLAQAPSGGSSATLVARSFPRSFTVAGTDLSLRIGGQAVGNVLWYFKGATPGGALGGQGSFSETYTEGPGGLALFSIPLEGTQAHSRSEALIFSAKQSRIFLDARQASPYGDIKAFVELDFNAANTNTDLTDNQGSFNGYIPRLRQGYATIGPWLVGQTWSTFIDNDAGPELLDFNGGAGGVAVARTPLVRYTYQLPDGFSVAVAAENPALTATSPFGPYNTDTNQIPTIGACAALTAPAISATTGTATIAGNSTAISSNITNACLGGGAFFNSLQQLMPTFVLAGRVDQPWGHLQMGLTAVGTTLNDGLFLNKTYLGYGASLSGNVIVWGRDNLTFGFVAGNGLLGVTTNFGGALAGQSFNATDSRSFFTTNRALYDSAALAKTVVSFSPRLGFQHWWTADLRSTVDFSLLHVDYDALLLQASGRSVASKQVSMAHANLIWSPAAFVDVGIEGAWGYRATVGNNYGNEYTLQSSLKVRF
jgi:hypothetical protein